MPIIKSAKKAAKQSLVKRDRNYLTRTALRKAIRAFSDAVKGGKKTEAEKLLVPAFKIIDTAAKKKVLEKNTAARRKSLLARKLAGIKA
ncbi:MAG: 30S ribosomal protein S20 [Candidatus Gracilibacteria bacterium]|jgi:small subunit ribosomal protein S20